MTHWLWSIPIHEGEFWGFSQLNCHVKEKKKKKCSMSHCCFWESFETMLCVTALRSQSAGAHLNKPAALQRATHNTGHWQIYGDKIKASVFHSTGAESHVRHHLGWNQACTVLLFTKPGWPWVHVCLSENTRVARSKWTWTMTKRRASVKALCRLTRCLRFNPSTNQSLKFYLYTAKSH